MNSPQVIYTLRWSVRETFRQALATRIFWIMLAFSAVCVLFCLSVSVEGGEDLRPEKDFLYDPVTKKPVEGPQRSFGKLHLLFGAFSVDLPRDREMGVHFLHVILGTWVAGGAGLLLTLLWTAGFLPESLQASNASVLFAKPAPRWLFLVGKYVAVVLFVALQASIFFIGTWLALGVKTNVWIGGYLAGIPLLVLHFAVIYSFSALLATLTRSTVACMLGSVLFWVVCLGVNYGRHAAVALPALAPEIPPLSPFTTFLIDASYWMLPKPADFVIMLEQAMNAGTHFVTLASLPHIKHAQESGAFDAGGSILTSILFAVVMMLLAGRQLEQGDY